MIKEDQELVNQAGRLFEVLELARTFSKLNFISVDPGKIEELALQIVLRSEALNTLIEQWTEGKLNGN